MIFDNCISNGFFSHLTQAAKIAQASQAAQAAQQAAQAAKVAAALSNSKGYRNY